MKKTFLAVIAVSAIVLASCANNEEKAPASSASEVVNETILSRRSVRSYKPVQVSKDTVDLILKAGINAPSANNKQPWEVRVVRNPELLEKIKATSSNFYDAPTLFIIAYDATNESGQFDAGLFTQNVMISAESFGLGTVALGHLARNLNNGSAESAAVLEELGFPAEYKVVVGLSLGYKNESPDAKPRDAEKVKYID